jgi:hypothetical protein
MPGLLQPDNHNKKYEALFVEIDTGQIKLPMFQREFVWEKEQSAKLIDSILKGFPIGTFIFWKTKEDLRSYKDVGNHRLPDTPEGDYVQYILDGQQRITSLYAIRKGIRISKDGVEIDYKDSAGRRRAKRRSASGSPRPCHIVPRLREGGPVQRNAARLRVSRSWAQCRSPLCGRGSKLRPG